MGRQKKYEGLYGRQEAYLKSPKGKEALKRYRTSEKGRTKFRDLARKRRGTIVDKHQWFIDTYGDIETALNLLDDREREVIELVHGLDGNEAIKQKEVAERWGKSHQWVSVIKKAALAKLEDLKKAKEVEED